MISSENASRRPSEEDFAAMKSLSARRTFVLAVALTLLALPVSGLAQSRRTPPQTPQKKNTRPGQTEEPQQQEPLPPDIVNDKEAEIVKVTSALVNVEAVVYNKKTKQIITGLKKENFAVFEDGIQKDIT